MEEMFIEIAGFIIKVNYYFTDSYFLKQKIKNDIFTHYKFFLIKKIPAKFDFTINIKPQETRFIFHKKINKKSHYFFQGFEELKNKVINTYYSISLAQFEFILRRVLNQLLYKTGGFMFHASCSFFKNKVIMFSGKSGAGKSTIATLINDHFPRLDDESVIIKKTQNKFLFYPSPFIRKCDPITENTKSYPIHKIFFLHQAKYFKIKKIENRDAISRLALEQLWVEQKYMKKQIKNLLQFISQLDEFYFLYFAKDKEKLIKLLKNNL